MKTFRKLFFLTLVLAALWSVMTVEAAAATVPSGYTGISTAAELNNIRNNLSGKYILLKNISLSSYRSGTGWEPIGAANGETFTGVLDGNGYEISGLTINAPNISASGLGLFGGIDGATIKNLNLTGNGADDSQTFAFTFADQQDMTCRLFFLDADLQPLCKAIEP